MRTTERPSTPYPDIPPVLESSNQDFQDTGITSSLAILGHPIHPILVVFPVAFLVGAMGSDVGYFLTRDFFWARASTWLIGLGVVSGLAAGAVGMFDFFNVKRVRERSAGWYHMYGNIIALVLSGISWFMRLDEPADFIIPWGLIISVIVATLLGITGWFGGELSFRHKIGVIGSSSKSES
jgi:uncharacterized membrane protein